MSQTMAQLLISAGDRLNDANHARYSEPIIRRWINEGTRELARKAECLYGTTTIPVVASTQSYALPTDMIRVNSIQYELNTQVFALEFIERGAAQYMWGTNQVTQSAYPQQYSTWGQPGATTMNVYLFPVPSQAGLLRVWYSRLPVEIATDGSADTSSVDVPNGWEDALLDYTQAQCYLRDRRPDDYQMMTQRFNDRLLALAQTADRNFNVNPGMVVPLNTMQESYDWW